MVVFLSRSLGITPSVLCLFTVVSLLSSCGGGSGSSNEPEPPALPEPSDGVSERPVNVITQAWFRDHDGTAGVISGDVSITAFSTDESDTSRADSVWVSWANDQGSAFGETWLMTEASDVYRIEIPAGTQVPVGVSALLLYPANRIGQAERGTLVRFHDFTGNAALSGPGGNYDMSWYYGTDRPTISVHRTDSGELATCVFDNGLVSVVDMANERDEAWHASDGGLANQVDEDAFPPYAFACDEQPVNTHREVSDDFGVWTYSTINDAMFYGTLVYDTYLKYLGEPPLAEKIRLRVHYAGRSRDYAYWDGAYANFSDGYPYQFSMAPLDAIAHEVGHGVLNRIASDLNVFESIVSIDTRTVHEAFADISGVMAKYALTGNPNQWVHGEEAGGLWVRHLDQIQTEYDAIPSLLDYDDAGDNYYLRIGMMTYPFYRLATQWGLEPAYQVYIDAARHCWQAMMSLTEAAECIQTRAVVLEHPEQDVIDAFKTVKIALFEEGVLSHFTFQANPLLVVFSDNSQSTSHVTQWLWDFGDGQRSMDSSPEHVFAEPGDYLVSLTVTDQSGDQDSFTRRVTVKVIE